MNHLTSTVTPVVVAALSLVAACGDLEASASDTGSAIDKQTKSPAPTMPVRDHTNRIDFGDDGRP